MKKILILVLLLISVITTAQTSIGSIKIRSKISLIHDSRTQISDTIYVSIREWVYDPVPPRYVATVVDYVKSDSITYKKINEKTKFFTKEEVDGLFTMLNNSIMSSESYSSEMDILLATSLLLDTKTNLFENGTTIYGGVPANWELVTD